MANADIRQLEMDGSVFYPQTDINGLVNNGSYAIDDEPTPGSENLVRSGGVASHIVYDISEAHNGTTYADLAAALGTNGANVPESIRHGGMTVSFVSNSDNKYVRFVYTGTDVTASMFTNPTNWIGITSELEKINGNVYKIGYKLDTNTGLEIPADGYGVSDFIPIELYSHQYLYTNSDGNFFAYNNNKEFITSYSPNLARNVSYGSKYIRVYFKLDDSVSKLEDLTSDVVLYTKVLGIISEVNNTLSNDINQLDNTVNGNIVMYKKLLSDYSIVDSDDTAISDFIPISSYSLSHTINAYTTGTCYAVAYNANKEPITYYSIYNGTRTGSFSYGTAFIRITCGIGKNVPNIVVNDTTIWKRKMPLGVDDGTIKSLEEEVNGNIVEYGKRFTEDGSLIIDADYGITDYIPIELYNQTCTFYAANAKHAIMIAYNANKEYLTYYAQGTRSYGYGTAYMRLNVPIDSLSDAYLYNTITEKYLWRKNLSLQQKNEIQRTFNDDCENNYGYSILKSQILNAITLYRQTVSKAIKNNLLTFGFLTDVHLIASGGKEHIQRIYTMTKYAKSSPARFLLFGGDLVSGEYSISLDMQTMQNGKEAFNDNFGLPIYIVRGNHDGGHQVWNAKPVGSRTDDDIETVQDWYNMMISSVSDIIKDSANPMGGYFYKDFEDAKIRLIVLNLYDMTGTNADGDVYNAMYSKASIRQAEATWLVNKALNFMDKGEDRSNWGIIVASHDGVESDNHSYGDADKVELMLQAFKNGGQYSWTYSYNNDPNYYVNVVADFRKQGAIGYLAYIHGHTHTDRVVFQNGVPHISSGAAHPDETENLPAGATLALPRVIGQVSEYLWDSIAIGSNDISLYRFGAGHNRYVHQGGISVAINGTTTLTPTKLTGTLTWGSFSVSSGYYTPVVDGVEGAPVGTLVQNATVNAGTVTGVSVGDATVYAEDENGNREFWGIIVTE